MKKYDNFRITWTEDGAAHETVIFSKLDAIREYINFLCGHVDSGRNISSLRIFGVTRRSFELEDITWTVNKFLNN